MGQLRNSDPTIAGHVNCVMVALPDQPQQMPVDTWTYVPGGTTGVEYVTQTMIGVFDIQTAGSALVLRCSNYSVGTQQPGIRIFLNGMIVERATLSSLPTA